MLFSGGSAGTKGTPPKESKKERKPDKDEKYEIKEAVFLRWANSIIDGDLQDLREIADVKYLSKFATLILGVPVALSGKNEADDIDAIFHAMVPDDPDDRLFQISVNDLLSGNQKALLTMCWQLIQIFWEKFAPAPSNERKMVEALKEWCLDATASYPDVIINDFTSSFRDGMAINILIKSFDDSLIDLSEISELRGEDRIENALSLARRHFRVPKLIQPKEFYSEHLDMKSVSCYLMMLYLGMCESSTRPQRIPSTRRRSTLATTTVGNESTSAPSTPSQPQQTNITQTAITTTALASEITAEAVTSFPEATIHSQMQQQQILSGLPVARHSIAQAIVQIPVIYAQQQNLVQSAHLTDSSNSVASAPPYTGGNSLQRIIQANMLTPPSNSQSSKAFIPLLQTAPSTTTTAVISPLAQQSHNQAQLLEHQKQIESLQQKEQQQPLFQPPTVQIQSTSQLPMILMQQQTTSHNYRPLQLLPPLPQVIPSNQPLPSLNNSPNREFNQQLSPKSLAQFTLPPQQSIAISDISMETGMRSRKSSSCSSSRTSRSRRKPEELLQEYGDYLQQVLTWLNEAEQELELMSPTQKDENEIPSLEIAKEKFHEHEKYMQSLTQSQESVGRVLHRGHHLSKKLEDPEESTTIINQLQSVQSRWELIRTGAMERQTALQQQIEKIQKAHLNELIEWLEGIERRSRQQLCPLAENVDVCLKQRVEAGALKRQMDEKQPAFAQLSSFVEVVEQISQQKQISNVQNLEILVKQVDKRWNKLLELISLHIKLLEGLGDLLEKYEQLNNEIFEWLNEKTNKLNKLKTPNELNTEEEVQNYLESLRSMEKALENQKELFEHFSNICNELANRFEKGKNLSASQNVLAKLYEINNKRDGILKILEENSEMLIQSGKVKLQTSELPITSMEDEEQPRRKITLETIYSVDESRRGSESPQSAAKKRKLLQLPPAEHLTIEETEEGPMKKEFRFEEEKIKEMRELKGDDEINPIKEQQLSPTSKQTEEEKTSTLLNQFVQKVTSLNQKLQPLIEWTKSEFVQQQMPSQQEKESSTYKKPQNIRQAVLNCQKRLNEIREMEPAVTKLQIQLEFLHNRVKLSSKQLHEVNEIFDEFMSCWSRVVGAISKVLSNLSRPEPLIKSPSKTPERQQKHSTNPNKIFLMIEQLDQWLIASSKYLDELPQQMPTNDKFDKIAKIAKQLGEQQAHLSHLKRLTKLTPEETKALLELEKRMISLLNRIDKLTDATEEEEEESKLKIEEKIRPQIGSRLSPRTTTVQLKQDTLEDEQHLIPSTSIQKSTSPPLPLDEAETLRMKLLAEEEDLNIRANLGQEKEEDEWSKWLREKEKELNLNEECIPGDLKSLSAQLEKCDEMIAELRNKRCAASSSESDVEMVGPIEGLLRAAETKRNHCVDSINKTQLAIHKAVKLEEIGDQFKRELEWLRKNLSVDESSLRESFERIKYLKNSLQLQEETKKEALNLLEEVAQIALNNTKNKIGNISGEQMRERINKLKNQWKMLENEIEELLDCCNRESQRRAKSWLNSLKLILEELEQALKGSFESATDAEELSEHLDNLERLLDRLGSIEREAEEEGYRLEITEYHPQLIELTKQRESLIQATYERCTQLRNAVAHCEHFEQRLCQMHNWGTNMQQILNQRLASDTYSLEVPNEYKDSQRTGTLFKKMDKEFSEYDKLVAELDEYIRQSKSEFASTERLKLQLDHANQQLSLLRPKFAKFKQPIGLFERMDRIQQQLAEIESSMDDLAGIEAENCEFCLLHLEQIQHQLEELSTDCSACEASRDTLIREGIIEEKQALKLSAQLSEMTTKCVDELENRATTNIQRLKRAVDFVEKLDRESAVLDKLLGEIENRLQSDDYKNEKPVQRSLKIIDELYRQLRATTDSTAKAKELESSLRNLAIRITKEKIECIKNAEQRCSKLRDKLDEWNELINKQMIKIPTKKEIEKQNPLNEQIKLPEGIFNEINELAKELDKRFGQLEKQNQMPSFQLNERLNSLRPLKERFEYLSLQTVSRKDFGSKVAPLLANLSSRWQNLTKNALDRKRQEEQIKYQENLQLLQEQQCTSPLSFGEISPTTAYEGGLSESLEDVRDFGQQVQSTIEHFERAKRHLNYSRHPVNSLHDWEQRLTKIGQYVANRKLNFDVLIAGGKHIAESGPMELLTSAALSKLDELIDLVHNVDEQVEREEQRLHNICQQFGVFNGQIQMAKERLEAMEMKADALNTRAIDPTPIITLQQELMDTSGQMQLLQLSADELRKSLPSTMCEQQIGGDVLDQLNRQLHEIESRVQSALLRALQYRQDEDVEINEEGEIQRKQLWQPEDDLAIASTSTTRQVIVPYPSEEQQLEIEYKGNIDGIPSTSEPSKEFVGDEYIEEKGNIGMRQRRTVAKPKGGQRMGEEEKDEEEEEEEGIKSTTTDQQQQRRRWRTAAAAALAPPSQIAQQQTFLPLTQKRKGDAQQFMLKGQQKIGEQTGGMDQFYVSLNIMEDYMEQQQHLNALPYETFDEKAEILKDFEMELQRGEQLLNENLMTLEVGESEHLKARIAYLRRQFEEKRSELESRRETIRALEQHYSQCEQMLDELSNICKEPRRRLIEARSPKNEENGEEDTIYPAESRDSSPDLDELEAAQARLENYLPPIAVRLQQIQNRLNILSEHLSAAAHNKFQQKLRLLVEDFNERTKEVRIKRDQLEIRLADQSHLKQLLEDLEFWCDESEAILETFEQIGPLNIKKLEKQQENIQKRYYSADTKLESFRQLERLKDRFANLVSVEPQVKHEVRRDVANLGKRLSDVRIKLKERMDNLLTEKWSADELWREFAALNKWGEEAEQQIYAVENAKIFKPSLVNIENLAGKLSENRLALQNIQQRLNQQAAVVQKEGKNNEVEKENLKLVENLLIKFVNIERSVERLLEQKAAAFEENSSEEEEIENLYNKMNETKEKLSKEEPIQHQQNGFHYPQESFGQENGHLIEYGTLSTQSDGSEENGDDRNDLIPINPEDDKEENKKYPRRKMSLADQSRLDTVTRLRSWLQEVERDVAASVDLSDQNLIRQMLGKIQNFVDDIQIHQLEIIKVLDEAKDRLIIERTQICSAEMERILGLCKRRKGDLQKLLEQCRLWEQLRGSLELWLNQANDKLISGGRVIGLSDNELSEQLDLCNQLTADSDQWEEKLREMNRISNHLLEIYRRDDGHNLSHLNSKLNTQWTKFNDQLRIRRSVVEAAQRSRFDFQTALGHFQQWMQGQCLKLQKLANETENQQKLKDTGLRSEWLGKEKSANMEIDAHKDMMESVKKMGRKLLEEQQQELINLDNNEIISTGGREREILLKRVESIESEWNALLALHKIIKERLENAQEECDHLIQSLSDFLFWIDQQRKTIANTQPVGGDLNTVERQCGILRTIQRGIEAREQPVEECIKLAHEFLMQHNLRPPIHHPSLMAEPPVDPYSPKTEAEREERRVGQQINSDSKQLQENWIILKEELTVCYQRVADTHKEMQELDRSMAEALLSIGTVEGEIQTMRPVENLLLEDLNLEKVECLEFRQRVHEAGTHVDDVNNWASSIQAMGIELSDQLEHQVLAINERYERLKRDIGCRWAALERALNDFGPASENFLVDLVDPPWQRAISTTNRLPYYIDHSAEHTQWDHPAMVDILEGLCSFNQVKFSAYRTAMKLRALQKRLCLDLIDLSDLNMQYTKHLSNYADERRIQVEDVIQCLLPLFEKAHEERPALVPNVSLSVDLTLNLLLNIFDPCRDAKMRVLSFKIALVVLCHATLEAKYTYLFHLISNKDGVDHKQLAVLFYDLIHIPKFLGEAAAFGGSNIEPSVRSCFEHSKFPPNINSDQFLDWLKREPQSLVWLPVMHRLASSEFAKHQAKCNACKMFPIVGLRYRCLRCFNFDICQNCFFSQRIAKSHKLNHPMQEYCTPTSTGDDVRDFTAVIKNKVRQGKGRIGYLPVEQINEGPPLECAEQTPQNSETESIHQRMNLIASRLEKRQTEAAEHFPLAVILPSDVKINGIETNGIMGGGGMHTPIMIDNEKENEDGNKQQNGISSKLSSIPGLAPNYQSPEIQIYHDQQRNAQIAAVVLAAQQEAKSPSQLVTQVDQASKEELGQLLQKLQYENIELKRKIEERRKAIYTNNFSHQATTSTPNLRTPLINEDIEKISEIDSQQKQINIEDPHKIRAKSIGTVGLPTIFSQQTILPPPLRPYPVPALHRQYSLGLPINLSEGITTNQINEQTNDRLQQMAVLVEAQKLRLHQKRLEERGIVLEEQNKQLQQQLDRLQKLMEKKSEINLTPTQRRTDEIQAGIVSSTDAEDTDMEMLGINRKSAGGISSGQIGTEIRRNRMDRLRETVNELNKAMEHFVQFTQHCSAVSGTTAALRRDIENENGDDDNEEENDELDSGTADQDCFEEKRD